ncbi:AMP-binding protein [Streptomyces malaysiensis]|uniref:AMP-binding protein n=1 Tax=Streptomyces malaysiensis subsp. samsunensis TaxID=459658 RepID=A0A9X2RVQ3_STRMQ|nr:AMP-binding protein [Streptomyces samsunensis]MCQ8830024.1 AMP-binding protein [Streptomyces samsunensis]
MTAQGATTGVGSIGDAIITALRRFGDREALVCGAERLTYAQVGDAVARLRQALEQAGLRPGDTVAQITANRPTQWLVTAACYIAGFRSVTLPLNGLPPGTLRERLIAAGPALVVVDASRTAEVAGWDALRKDVVRVSDGTDDDGTAEGWTSIQTLLREQPAGPIGPAAPADAIVRLGYTSGATGTAKGVLLSSGALCGVALLNLAQADWPARPRVLCAEPVAGGFGNMVVPTLIRGGTFIMLETFSAGGFVDTAAAHRPNVLLAMPPALRAILAHPGAGGADWSGVGLVIYSGAVLTPDEIDRSHALFGQVLCGVFGQVEVPKTIAFLAPADHLLPERRTSLGLPWTGMTVQVQDRAGRPCPPGRAGEVCVKGPTVMAGYGGVRVPERPFRDGWLRTGDACRTDEHGYLHYLNRIQDTLDWDGELVCPADLEALLAAEAGVAPTAVTTLPEGGGVLVALPEPVRAGVADGIGDCLRTAGAPRVEVLPVAALPLDAMGRVDRRTLRAWWSDRPARPGDAV